GLYWPRRDTPSFEGGSGDWKPNRPTAAVIFYRARVQAGNVAVIDSLVAALDRAGLHARPLYATSRKGPVAADVFAAAIARAQRLLAILLANYPNRAGRLGNGVGLDTPAGTVTVLTAMTAAGYRIDDPPADAAALMARLLAGPTNSGRSRAGGAHLLLADYDAFVARLPTALRERMHERWGEPERDPFFTGGAFRLPIHRFGHV